MRTGLRFSGVASSLLIGLVSFAASAATPTPEPAVPGALEAAIPAPAPTWSAHAARDLLALVEQADREGLKPADYRPAVLARAIATGEGAQLDAAAGFAARTLAHDYLVGRITDRAAFGWLIAPDEAALAGLPDAIDVAVRSDRIGAFLTSLLPADARYRALRAALPEAADPAERDAIRANMERARWMPRTTPDRYLYVNVPSYRLEVVQGGLVTSTYTVVVGAPETPTPMLISDTRSLVVNPWWNVPTSIVKSANLRPGRDGYVFKAAAGGGWQVRQPPGPRNALGRIKFNLDNDQAIYLHDTPAKAGFRREARALSHGCIRVQGIDQLAGELMAEDDRVARLDTALADDATTTLRLPRTWSAYLVYFTRDVAADGRLVRYGDPYRRDPAMIAALDGGALQLASN